MYRYEPPKSSIWGHALRKMPAARARQLLKSFLDTTAESFCFSGGALSFFDGAKDYVAAFEAMLGSTSQNSRFDGLTEQQCERCIDVVAKDEGMGGKKAGSCILIQSFTVSRWKLPGQVMDTPSEISMYYGQGQFLSTVLQFSTVEDFGQVQKALADLGLCKLNEKQLKLVKERKTKPQSGG